ncbi:MAG TPA: sigma-70 family RNA polymerase sigma factor [Polyangia bacterium]|jgi:RNA polymerase sigma-32 factor
MGWYLHDVRRYPLLTREEEHQIALEYARTGKKALADRLTTANLRLVVKIALEYKRAHHNLLDLIQEGNMGLVRAVEKYDARRGVKLATYASWWIRAYILKFILANARLVKIGTTQAQRRLFFGLGRERTRLEKRGDGKADTKHLAAVFDVNESLIVEMERRLGSSEASLDAPMARGIEGGDRTRGESLSAEAEVRPDVQSETSEFRAALRRELAVFEKTLKGRDIEIFHARLMAEDGKTLMEIAETFGVSRERVRQIESRLKKRLRQHLRQTLGDAVPAEHESGALTM